MPRIVPFHVFFCRSEVPLPDLFPSARYILEVRAIFVFWGGIGLDTASVLLFNVYVGIHPSLASE